ncbi:MAG: hypothetical protein A3F77_15155 [Betaproteobacteria bacterium RIFCSPLOWO2_12_FULL_67_28]|nr:MAG: hypothetical protein A3I65_11930 [Betaproteobacteria bacterium RIFCSPLOWO2_02_FULL_68_150]OGA64164.1 MAG: hypothetical protein A3F77_15155 [Betaproteobacteria bacterium RIFCSPLOWO2_12_FULL_67_28]
MIGGYALFALGYERGTTDIDVLVKPTRAEGEKVKQALLQLPDRAARDLDPAWFEEGNTIRIADEIVVDLLFSACGETLDSLKEHIVTIYLEDTPVRTLDIEGLLKTKQSLRHKDQEDRQVLERALRVLRNGA